MIKIKNLYATLALSLLMSLTACGDASDGNAGQSQKVQAAAPAAVTPAKAVDSAAPSAEQKVIKIAYLPITHSLAGFEAAEIEKLKKDGLNIELVKFGSWTELMDALNTGNVDAAVALVELVMKAREQGVDVYLASLAHRDGNVIVVGNDIGRAADLKGKTFAIPHRQSSHNILLNDALATAGLTVDDVNVTELAPTEMPSALASGQIDGYCVAEPFGAMGVNLGVGKVLFSSEELWENSLCCGLVLTDKFIAERHDDAKSFVENYKKAGNSLDKAKAKEIAKKYFSQSDEVLDTSLQWISYNDLDITEDEYNTLAEKVKKYGLSDNPPSYSEFVANDF